LLSIALGILLPTLMLLLMGVFVSIIFGLQVIREKLKERLVK